MPRRELQPFKTEDAKVALIVGIATGVGYGPFLAHELWNIDLTAGYVFAVVAVAGSVGALLRRR